MAEGGGSCEPALYIYNASSEAEIYGGILSIIDRIHRSAASLQVKKLTRPTGLVYFVVTVQKNVYLNFIYNKKHMLPKSWRVEYKGIQQDAVVVTITMFSPIPASLCASTNSAAKDFLASFKGYFNYDILLNLKVVNSDMENSMYLNQAATSSDPDICLQPMLKVDIAPQNGSGVKLVVNELDKICNAIGKYWPGYCVFLTAVAEDLATPPGSTIIISSPKDVQLPKKDLK